MICLFLHVTLFDSFICTLVMLYTSHLFPHVMLHMIHLYLHSWFFMWVIYFHVIISLLLALVIFLQYFYMGFFTLFIYYHVTYFPRKWFISTCDFVHLFSHSFIYMSFHVILYLIRSFLHIAAVIVYWFDYLSIYFHTGDSSSESSLFRMWFFTWVIYFFWMSRYKIRLFSNFS